MILVSLMIVNVMTNLKNNKINYHKILILIISKHTLCWSNVNPFQKLYSTNSLKYTYHLGKYTFKIKKILAWIQVWKSVICLFGMKLTLWILIPSSTIECFKGENEIKQGKYFSQVLGYCRVKLLLVCLIIVEGKHFPPFHCF